MARSMSVSTGTLGSWNRDRSTRRSRTTTHRWARTGIRSDGPFRLSPLYGTRWTFEGLASGHSGIGVDGRGGGTTRFSIRSGRLPPRVEPTHGLRFMRFSTPRLLGCVRTVPWWRLAVVGSGVGRTGVTGAEMCSGWMRRLATRGFGCSRVQVGGVMTVSIGLTTEQGGRMRVRSRSLPRPMGSSDGFLIDSQTVGQSRRRIVV